MARVYVILTFLCCCAAIFGGIRDSFAGAWTLEAGKTQYIYKLSEYKTNRFYDAHGKSSLVNKYEQLEFQPYAEYGLYDDVTIGATGWIQQLSKQLDNGNQIYNHGYSGVELFLRKRLWYNSDLGSVLSLQSAVKTPSNYRDDDNNSSLTAGHDNFEAEISLQYGHSFELFDRYHYVSSSMSYRKRAGSLGNQWKFDISAGLRYNERWELLPELNIVRAAFNELSGAAIVSGQSDYHLVKGNISLLYNINHKYSFQFGGFRHIYSRNTGGGDGLFVALWIKY